jgi:putative aldouronate transport system permease protein
MPIYGLSISFKDYSPGLGINGSSWANPWYKYYVQFFSSPYFVRLITNTVILSVLKIIFGMIFPITLALLLNECRYKLLKKLTQTLTYMPHFLSWVVIYGILLAFFSQSTGAVNNVITRMGGEAVPFLVSNKWFRQIVVISDIWQSAGWSAIIYLAAISAIDPTLYEAGRMDGIGRVGQIWYITLPCIQNTIIMLFILKVGSILDAGFDQIYNIYSVQVYQVGDIIDTWVYRTGLLQMNFSLATAVGLFKSIIGFCLVLTANKMAKMWGGGGIW